MTFHRFNEMDVQEACISFITLEEGIAEDDEDVTID